jgi:hypothetical protein
MKVTHTMRLVDTYRALSSGAFLSDDEAVEVIQTIDRNLRFKEATGSPDSPTIEANGHEFDDAWETIALLSDRHHNVLGPLVKAAACIGKGTYHDVNARVWAIRAMQRIGRDISFAVPCLVDIVRGDNRELRQEAAGTLRKCGYGHLIKRHWNDFLDWRVR